MVTTIGNSGASVRIGDNATPGAGTYELYLNPQQITETETDHFTISVPVSKQIYTTNSQGMVARVFRFLRCKFSTDYTTYGNFKKAWTYWMKNDTLLYLKIKDVNGNNLAVLPNWDTLVLQQMQGKILRKTTKNMTSFYEYDIDFQQATR